MAQIDVLCARKGYDGRVGPTEYHATCPWCWSGYADGREERVQYWARRHPTECEKWDGKHFESNPDLIQRTVSPGAGGKDE